jgi:M-phase phosphoprotein 6
MVSGGSAAPLRASLSERLRGMNFMKRREERVVRAGLTAAAEATADAAKWEANIDVSDGELIAAPLIIVEGGVGSAASAGAARAGRRSFGHFNKAVERDFAAAVVLARTGPATAAAAAAPPGEGTAVEKDAAAQYQRWKGGNVTHGAGMFGARGTAVRGITKKTRTKKYVRTKTVNSSGPDRTAQNIVVMPFNTAGSRGDVGENDEADSQLVETADVAGSDVEDGEVVDLGKVNVAMKARMSEKGKINKRSKSKAIGVGGSRGIDNRDFKKPKL